MEQVHRPLSVVSCPLPLTAKHWPLSSLTPDSPLRTPETQNHPVPRQEKDIRAPVRQEPRLWIRLSDVRLKREGSRPRYHRRSEREQWALGATPLRRRGPWAFNLTVRVPGSHVASR